MNPPLSAASLQLAVEIVDGEWDFEKDTEHIEARLAAIEAPYKRQIAHLEKALRRCDELRYHYPDIPCKFCTALAATDSAQPVARPLDEACDCPGVCHAGGDCCGMTPCAFNDFPQAAQPDVPESEGGQK
ncbi:MAG TPA: hypothetical protein VFJ93_07740 [Gaiellaceae bacterium]|nr:hypothetical protein [Gaiellaceae bacterium]